MNQVSTELAAREVSPERPAPDLRILSPEETGTVAAGVAVTLTLGALKSHAEINRPVRIDRIYRK